MSFTNVYYKRTAGTARACYVCYKPTTTVLATINNSDFLYSCPLHLEDHGFASKLGGADSNSGAGKVQVTDEEIAKVKAEWEEKHKAKLEGEKEKGKDGEKKTEGVELKKPISQEASRTVQTASPASPTPCHDRYALHRDFFAMRQAEHRKRRQVAQTKALAPRLPGAPTGSVEDKY